MFGQPDISSFFSTSYPWLIRGGNLNTQSADNYRHLIMI